ncbi:glycosyltransferase family 2 protein [Nocardioides sp.]|uniref:glycosyltransferase family 2 protein n=1 Tax=Nocardioides sp. TaxID=35761 RepID=UPI0039E48CE9
MTATRTEPPLFSIVTPVYNPPISAMREMVDSVLAQTLDDWELILVDDCSPDPEVRRVLRDYVAHDPRIRLVERETNGHIVAASNDGVALARGTFVGLLDHDDMLVRTALQRNAEVIAAHDDVDYIYSDEDKIDADGKHYHHFYKPDWSPERFRGHMYTCHFSVIRRTVLDQVGGFREGFDGSQDYDLVLRVTEVARRIEHIPKVLYHWRVVPGSTSGDPDAKPYAYIAAQKAIQEHLERQGLAGTVRQGVSQGLYRIERPLPAERRVSVVIPTRGDLTVVWARERRLVVEAVRSLLARTEHDNLEIVVVYDAVTPASVLDELQAIAGDRLVLVRFDEPFNYSRKINFGVLAATGDRIVLLNDDIEVRTDRWLEELVAPLEDPGVGATGAKLFFSDGRIQHIGLSFTHDGYFHPYWMSPGDVFGDFGEAVVSREVSGVTAACMAMRREVFLEVGGFSERLPVNYNDVDLNYKIRAAGYRVLYIASCELYHFESLTRGHATRGEAWEREIVVNRWGRPRRDAYTPDAPNVPIALLSARRRQRARS